VTVPFVAKQQALMGTVCQEFVHLGQHGMKNIEKLFLNEKEGSTWDRFVLRI
jgi:hypothetical protein|tara:strand:- start:426 stop:581 length:156 start_codon:yes stop_codon:yes gene_type:complete